jgi:hypothetical protein
MPLCLSWPEAESKEMPEQESSAIEKGMTQQTTLSIVLSPLYMIIQLLHLLILLADWVSLLL